MNKAYRNLILARAVAAIGAAQAISGVRHRGLKGQLREIVIRDLFRPLLPADIGVGTGEIISSDNQPSAEQDVVLFDRRIVPPILLEETKGIFPTESVLFTIEIKSRLTTSELKKAHYNARKLQTMPYLSGEIDEMGKPVPGPVRGLVSTLLAFDSDLAFGKTSEIVRYDRIRGEDPAPLRALCVVGRGCWIRSHDEQWIAWAQDEPAEEIIGLIVSIMNSYRSIAASRKQPLLGLYLYDQ